MQTTYVPLPCSHLNRIVYLSKKAIVNIPFIITSLESFTLPDIEKAFLSCDHSSNVPSTIFNLIYDINTFESDSDLSFSVLHTVALPTNKESIKFVHTVVTEICKHASSFRNLLHYFYVDTISHINSDIITDTTSKQIYSFADKVEALYNSFNRYDTIFGYIYWHFDFTVVTIRKFFKYVQKLFWMFAELLGSITTTEENMPADYKILYADSKLCCKVKENGIVNVNALINNVSKINVQLLTKHEYEKMNSTQYYDYYDNKDMEITIGSDELVTI